MERPESGGVRLTTVTGETATFDKVIFASHANQTLKMLADATPLESRLLSPFHYQKNIATVHTDAAVMPKTRRVWSSWNYRIGQPKAGESGSAFPTVNYWMNSLQGVSERENYFVSLNAQDEIDPAKVLRTLEYEHPMFSLDAMEAQRELTCLNQLSPEQTTYFCGSYFKYGFHEDAFTSALECARAVTGEPIWE